MVAAILSSCSKPIPVIANAERSGTEIVVVAEADQTTLDIRCPFGIDRASVNRIGDSWPDKLVIRLYLRGLESFRVENGGHHLSWSVPSTASEKVIYESFEGRVRQPIAEGDQSRLKMVGGKAIPLKDGYFEVEIPSGYLANNPDEIQLSWIDFYR